MSKSLQQLHAEIAALQQEAEALRKREVADVVKRIKDAIQAYGLTALDLGLEASGSLSFKETVRNAGRSTSINGSVVVNPFKLKPAKVVAPAKYRDAEGRTWGGRGARPMWLREAIAGGKRLEDFAAG